MRNWSSSIIMRIGTVHHCCCLVCKNCLNCQTLFFPSPHIWKKVYLANEYKEILFSLKSCWLYPAWWVLASIFINFTNKSIQWTCMSIKMADIDLLLNKWLNKILSFDEHQKQSPSTSRRRKKRKKVYTFCFIIIYLSSSYLCE